MSKNKRLKKLFFLLAASRASRQPRAHLRHHGKTRRLRIWLRFLVFMLVAAAALGICREFFL